MNRFVFLLSFRANTYLSYSLHSTFNWTVPFLSWLAIVALCVATVLIYYIPLRYIVLAWGECLKRSTTSKGFIEHTERLHKHYINASQWCINIHRAFGHVWPFTKATVLFHCLINVVVIYIYKTTMEQYSTFGEFAKCDKKTHCMFIHCL